MPPITLLCYAPVNHSGCGNADFCKKRKYLFKFQSTAPVLGILVWNEWLRK